MGTVVAEGPMFKLPTWSKGPASQWEKLFKLRYFALKREDADARLFYYESDKSYKAGGAPSGSIDMEGVSFQRVNKLDFVLTNEKKRLWCRAFSQQLADTWEEALAQVGVRGALAPNNNS